MSVQMIFQGVYCSLLRKRGFPCEGELCPRGEIICMSTRGSVSRWTFTQVGAVQPIHCHFEDKYFSVRVTTSKIWFRAAQRSNVVCQSWRWNYVWYMGPDVKRSLRMRMKRLARLVEAGGAVQVGQGDTLAAIRSRWRLDTFPVTAVVYNNNLWS